MRPFSNPDNSASDLALSGAEGQPHGSDEEPLLISLTSSSNRRPRLTSLVVLIALSSALLAAAAAKLVQDAHRRTLLWEGAGGLEGGAKAVFLEAADHSTNSKGGKSTDEADGEDDDDDECEVVMQDSPCHVAVSWALNTGLHEHPEWYASLKEHSFQAMQKFLSIHAKGTAQCKKPCKPIEDCETAKAGSECWRHIEWSRTEGIQKHPEWYSGLSLSDPMVKFQDHIHKDNKTVCPKRACTVATSFFCWAVVRKTSYEYELMKTQLRLQAGIFACDEFALISDTELNMDGVKTLVIPSIEVTGITNQGTSANTPVFVNAWRAIQADGRYKAHDWVLKADPDTVLVMDRLRTRLSPWNLPSNPYPSPVEVPPNAGTWVTNCDKMTMWGAGWGNGWPMMYGSLEIVSRVALDNYFVNEEKCKRDSIVPWMQMGEDAFMGVCLRDLRAAELFLKQGDGTCGGGDCSDHSFQAYHPYKDPAAWLTCWNKATR